MLAANPQTPPPPQEGGQIIEGRLGHPVPEVVGPPPHYRPQPIEQGGERTVGSLPGGFPHLRLYRSERGLGREGVHSQPICSSLQGPPNAEPQKVEAPVNVDDPRLLGRQAQAHREECRRGLLLHLLGLLPGTSYQNDKVVRVADESVGGESLPPVPVACAG